MLKGIRVIIIMTNKRKINNFRPIADPETLCTCSPRHIEHARKKKIKKKEKINYDEIEVKGAISQGILESVSADVVVMRMILMVGVITGVARS